MDKGGQSDPCRRNDLREGRLRAAFTNTLPWPMNRAVERPHPALEEIRGGMAGGGGRGV